MSETAVFFGLGDTALSVVKALAPLLGLFVVFQVFFLRLPRKHVLDLLKGSLVAAVGLLLFLQGVRTAFLPVGQIIGEALGNTEIRWLVIPFGFVIGWLAIWGEPAVRILGEQVEKASGGSVHKSEVLYSVCAGVSVFVALGLARVAYGIPFVYIIVPGYALAIVLLWFSDKEFLAIAFDAGGLATGPMSTTFLLAIAVGVASATEGRNSLVDGFGLVALVALAPILSVMALGIIIRLKQGREE